MTSTYTIREIALGSDSIYYAEPVKVYGQGDTVPAATPILFKCASPYASGNKVVPVGDIANHTAMPIANDLLMGNYFSAFTNHADFNNYDVTATYIPEQSTTGAPHYLALSTDANGYPTFMATDSTTYMAANSAWLDISDTNISAMKLEITSIRLGDAPEEPQEPELLIGDANGDGNLNVSDVSLLIEYVLHVSDEVYDPVYDVNQDGYINVEDITDLIQMILYTN